MRLIEYRQLLQIVVMFLIVQFAGLLLATQVFTGITISEVKSAQVVSSSINTVFLIAYIIVVSAILVAVFKIYRGDRLFQIFDAIIIVVPSFIVFLVVISAIQGNAFQSIYGSGTVISFVLAIVFALALVFAKYKRPNLRNLTAMIASVGVGLVLGVSFGFVLALLFMIILAAYDFIAVFITKHMVTLAKVAIDKNISGLIMVNEIEAVPVGMLSPAQRKEYLQSKKELEKRGGVVSSLVASNMVPMAASTALGTGDLAVPLMLAVAAYKVNLNFILSFVIIIGALFGLLLTMMILRKYKRALPAIPPLLFGISIALLTYFAILHL